MSGQKDSYVDQQQRSSNFQRTTGLKETEGRGQSLTLSNIFSTFTGNTPKQAGIQGKKFSLPLQNSNTKTQSAGKISVPKQQDLMQSGNPNANQGGGQYYMTTMKQKPVALSKVSPAAATQMTPTASFQNQFSNRNSTTLKQNEKK